MRPRRHPSGLLVPDERIVGPRLCEMFAATHLIGFGVGGDSFSPLDLTPALWVRSDLGITKDGSDLVSAWADQSGNARDFAEATNKPLWVDALVGGFPAIRFDGTNDILATASFSQVLPVHVFCIFNSVSWTSEEGIYGGTTNPSLRLFQFSSTPEVRMNGGTATTAAQSPTVGTFFLSNAYYNSATSNYHALNNGAYSASTADIGTGNPGGFQLGVGYDNGAGWSNVEIAEFIVYGSEIAGADLTNILSYFQTRYGLW